GFPLLGYRDLQMGYPRRTALLSRWRRSPPDIVHVATEGPLGLSALLAAADLGIPVSSSFHTNFHQYSGHYGVAPLGPAILSYLRHFHNRTRCTMVPTVTQAQELRSQGIANATVLARGIDTAIFNPARRNPQLRASWGVGPDDPVIGYVGRLAAEKNLDLVCRAFTAVRAANPAARLLLVGDGPEAGRYREIEGCICAGVRRDAELASHYASCDCFAFASLTETFGNVVTEALACGVPVVAFDYAAAALVLDARSNGRPIPVADADAFIAAVVELASDGALRRGLAAGSSQSVAHLTWDAITDRFLHLLTGCIDARRERRARPCA
ncbi:MAG: glycosyltransferase family 4 protein, partial [Planctomycetota bacterium]